MIIKQVDTKKSEHRLPYNGPKIEVDDFEKLKLRINVFDTVSDVIIKIGERLNINSRGLMKLNLIYMGYSLQRDNKIIDWGIEDGSVIQVQNIMRFS